MTTNTLGSRTLDGICYLHAPDLVALLRGRADEVEALALAMGDVEAGGPEWDKVVAYHSVAMELRERADWLDIAVITHLTEHPDDSDLSNPA